MSAPAPFVLLDIDDTILDFQTAEAAALRRTFTAQGIPIDDALIARYNAEDRNAVITDQGRRNADCDGVPGIDGSDVTTVLLFIARIIEDLPA